MDQQMSDFDMSTDDTPPAPPKRQRKKAPRREKPAATPRKKAVPVKNAGPKRARKKRAPRRLPGRTAEVSHVGGPPNVSPAAAGTIRSYMALDEADRGIVLAFLQALR